MLHTTIKAAASIQAPIVYYVTHGIGLSSVASDILSSLEKRAWFCLKNMPVPTKCVREGRIISFKTILGFDFDSYDCINSWGY